MPGMSVWHRLGALGAALSLLVLGGAVAGTVGAATITDTTTSATTATSTTETATEPTPTGTTAETGPAPPADTVSPPPATTTAPTTTAAPTATLPTATLPAATAARPRRTTAVARTIDTGCLLVGGIALLRPDRSTLVVGSVGVAPSSPVEDGPPRYPANGAIVRAGGTTLAAGRCSGSARAASGGVSVHSLSLFGGAVQADSVAIRVQGGRLAAGSAIRGLRVAGRAVRPRPGAMVLVGDWAYLSTLSISPSAGAGDPRLRESALAVHLLSPRAGLPAGTTLLVAFADLPGRLTAAAGPAALPFRLPGLATPRAAPKHSLRLTLAERLHLPLKVTPPLGRHLDYVFPVAANVSVADTYGAGRSDVPGGWHHGDDIFVPIGTPVVAVADGTLNRVGWEKVGGWRLWVRDKNGDEFYYAHLSGYTPLALRGGKVKAGQVLGFVGDSGDAATTPPHLHFEVHPRTLLRLHYDGAVDPTRYLLAWPHVVRLRAAKPVRPPLPRGAERQLAARLFRKLLVLRGYATHPKQGGESLTPPRQPEPVVTRTRTAVARARRTAANAPAPQVSPGSGWVLGASFAGGTIVLAPLAYFLAAAARRRRRGGAAGATAEAEPSENASDPVRTASAPGPVAAARPDAAEAGSFLAAALTAIAVMTVLTGAHVVSRRVRRRSAAGSRARGNRPG